MNFCCRIYYRCLPFIPSQTSMCWNIWQRESRSSLQLVISFDEIKLQKYNATIQCRNYLIRCWWDMAFFLLFLYSLLWNFPNGTNLSPPTMQCLCFLRPTQKKISARTCSTPPFFYCPIMLPKLARGLTKIYLSTGKSSLSLKNEILCALVYPPVKIAFPKANLAYENLSIWLKHSCCEFLL